MLAFASAEGPCMARKSTIVTLGILGAVAASLGVCCCGGLLAPEDDALAKDKDKKDGGHGAPHVAHRGPRLFPFFLPRSGPNRTVTHLTGPSALPVGGHPTGGHPTGGSSSIPRGGFGSTGHSGGVGVGA
jgi:hypothetical protein